MLSTGKLPDPRLTALGIVPFWRAFKVAMIAQRCFTPPGPSDSGASSAKDRRVHAGDDFPESRVLKPRRAAPADAVRPTRAEINLEALRHNLRVVKRTPARARVGGAQGRRLRARRAGRRAHARARAGRRLLRGAARGGGRAARGRDRRRPSS